MMQDDVYLALLIFFAFLNPIAKISSFQVHPDLISPSLNKSSSFLEFDWLIEGTLNGGSKLKGFVSIIFSKLFEFHLFHVLLYKKIS